MAHTDKLPSDVLDAIAPQIGERIVALGAQSALSTSPLEVAETLSVWTLTLDALSEGAAAKAPLTQLAKPTGRWHHQIRAGGQPVAFARSVPFGADAATWSVREFFLSDIAKQIDEGIEWVDQNIHEDDLVRLLIVPAYHLHGLWLIKTAAPDSRVYVVDCPASFQYVRVGTLYASADFLQNLLKEQHIQGILAP